MDSKERYDRIGSAETRLFVLTEFDQMGRGVTSNEMKVRARRLMEQAFCLEQLHAARAVQLTLQGGLESAREKELERWSQLVTQPPYKGVITAEALQAGLAAKFDKTVPKVVARSFLVYGFATFEVIADALARRAKKARGVKLSFADLRGSGMERLKLYFSKVVHLQIAHHPNWAVLCNYQELRNAIVHTGGEVKQGDDRYKALKELERSRPGLLQVLDGKDEGASVSFGPELLDRFFSDAEDFLSDLFDLVWTIEQKRAGTITPQRTTNS